jgi:hypothetical protein
VGLITSLKNRTGLQSCAVRMANLQDCLHHKTQIQTLISMTCRNWLYYLVQVGWLSVMVFISLETQNHLAFFDNIIILMVGLRNLRRNRYFDNSHFKTLIYAFYAAMCNEIKNFMPLFWTAKRQVFTDNFYIKTWIQLTLSNKQPSAHVM